MFTHYQTLDVPPAATQEEVKLAYRALSRLHHPDLGGDKDTYQKITEAYAILGDKNHRNIYDTTLRLLGQPCSVCCGHGIVWKQKGFKHRVAVLCAHCNHRGYI